MDAVFGEWNGNLMRQWETFWMEVIMHEPSRPRSHFADGRFPVVDEYVMTRYTHMLLHTSPYGDQPATVGPGSLPARERNPPGDQPDTPPNTAVSQQEQEVVPSIWWLLFMMTFSMYPAHAAIVRSGLLTPARLLEGTERLGIFIDLANAAADYAGVRRSLNFEPAPDGSDIIIRLVADMDNSDRAAAVSSQSVDPVGSDSDSDDDTIMVVDSDWSAPSLCRSGARAR